MADQRLTRQRAQVLAMYTLGPAAREDYCRYKCFSHTIVPDSPRRTASPLKITSGVRGGPSPPTGAVPTTHFKKSFIPVNYAYASENLWRNQL